MRGVSKRHGGVRLKYYGSDHRYSPRPLIIQGSGAGADVTAMGVTVSWSLPRRKMAHLDVPSADSRGIAERHGQDLREDEVEGLVDGTTGDETYKSGATERICKMREMNRMVGACDDRGLARKVRTTDMRGIRDFQTDILEDPGCISPRARFNIDSMTARSTSF